jgi:hypothetical protein
MYVRLLEEGLVMDLVKMLAKEQYLPAAEH